MTKIGIGRNAKRTSAWERKQLSLEPVEFPDREAMYHTMNGKCDALPVRRVCHRARMGVDSGLPALNATLQSEPAVRRASKTESTTQRNTYAHVELTYKALDVLRLIEVPEYLLGKPVLIQN
jgi:hypothetical protein